LTGTAGAAGASTYAYDALGRLTSRADSAGTASFTYTASSQLRSETDPLTGVAQSFTYDDAGQPTQVTYGTAASAAKRTLVWDAQGRLSADTLKTSSGTVANATTYGYDANSNVTSQVLTQTKNSAAG
jgi:YD repeat-containing protein